MNLDYCNILDKIGNDMNISPVHLSRKTMVDDAISTGSLVCDLIIGGGWPAGRWVTLFGQEASCKSTLLYHTLNNVIKKNFNAEFLDFEGSTDPSYIGKIIGLDLSSVFGARKENGAWEIAPKCRYYQPDIGEIYLRYMHRILKVLPDKLQHNNRWYYVMDKKPTKEQFDENLYKRTKRYWVPCDDSGSQIIWFIDSLPAMLTETMDQKDESKEIGLQARMFSKYIPLLKSRLARKRCSIVAVNQIRMKPMAWGNPLYEPCGEAPKFYSDIRLQCTSCSNPFPGKSGQIEEEPCWDEIGIDKYRYIKVSTKKNKCFSPYRNSLMRVWVEEKGDIGRGLDPVFDTVQYMLETGQAEKLRGDQYLISLPGPWSERKWKWLEIKELILNPNKLEVYNKFNFNLPDIGKVEADSEKSKILEKKLDIRQICFDQIKSDEAFKLYFDNTVGKSMDKKSEEDSESNSDNV